MKKEKIIIDKEYLKGFKSILIVFENCDVYELKIADILDIDCVVKRMCNSINEYRTRDGFIKIAARASQTIESRVLRDNKMGTEWDHRLKERLEMCGGGVDMTLFSLRTDRNCDMDIYEVCDGREKGKYNPTKIKGQIPRCKA